MVRQLWGMLLAAVLVLAGVAQADETKHSSLSVNGVDIWNAQCKSPKTHCLFAYICDDNVASGDLFSMVVAGVTPTALYGTGDLSFVYNNNCNTAGVLLCRAGTGVGAIKALIVVTHPLGQGTTQYELNFGCFDKDKGVLPDAADSLTLVTHNP